MASRILCTFCGALVLMVGLTVAFVVAPSATGTPNQDTTAPASTDPPPPAPDPAPVPKPKPKPAPKAAPKPTAKPAPSPKPAAVQPTPAQAPTPTYTPPARASSPKPSAVVKTKPAGHKVKPKKARTKASAGGVLAAHAIRLRDVQAAIPLAPPVLGVAAPERGAVGPATIFIATLTALALLLIGFVAVPMTLIRSHALVHVRWAYGSGIGTVGCALLLVALATLVLSHGGH